MQANAVEVGGTETLSFSRSCNNAAQAVDPSSTRGMQLRSPPPPAPRTHTRAHVNAQAYNHPPTHPPTRKIVDANETRGQSGHAPPAVTHPFPRTSKVGAKEFDGYRSIAADDGNEPTIKSSLHFTIDGIVWEIYYSDSAKAHVLLTYADANRDLARAMPTFLDYSEEIGPQDSDYPIGN